jgi:hypothetical protein
MMLIEGEVEEKERSGRENLKVWTAADQPWGKTLK